MKHLLIDPLTICISSFARWTNTESINVIEARLERH